MYVKYIYHVVGMRKVFAIVFEYLQILPLFDKAETQNKLLRSVAGGGVEVLKLQARWDKFELMMESHQLMVKEQVTVHLCGIEPMTIRLFCLRQS